MENKTWCQIEKEKDSIIETLCNSKNYRIIDKTEDYYYIESDICLYTHDTVVTKVSKEIEFSKKDLVTLLKDCDNEEDVYFIFKLTHFKNIKLKTLGEYFEKLVKHLTICELKEDEIILKNYAGNIEVRVPENEWDKKFANVIMWYENLLRPVLLVYSNKKDDTNAIIDDEKLANIVIEFYSETLKSDSSDEDFELLKKVINKNRKVKFELCKYIKRGLGWKSLRVVQEDKAKVIKLGLEDKLMDYFISRENEQNK